MINFIRKLLCDHRWGNSNKLTRRHRTEWMRCRKCGKAKKG